MIEKSRLQAVIRSPKTRKYGLRVLSTIALIGVIGFLVLPPVVKSVAQTQLSKVLHRPVTVEKIHINPYALSITAEKLAIREKEGNEVFAGFDSLYLNLESLSLIRLGPVFGEVRLVNPTVRIARLTDKRYNFSDLLDEFLARPKNDDPVPPFSLNNIQITGGSIEFDDRALNEKHTVGDINISLPFISSMAYATESFVEPSFSARIDGSPLTIAGKSKPFADSLESEIALDVTDLQIAKYLDYVPVKLPIKVGSGALDADLKLVFHQEKEKASTLLLSGKASIAKLDVKESSGASLVSFKRLDLGLEAADIFRRKIVLDRVVLDSPEVEARVDSHGDINWLAWLRQSSTTGKTDASGPAGRATTAPFEWALGEAKLTGGVVRWTDASHEPSDKPFHASIEGIELDLKKLASHGKTPAEFDLSWKVLADEWLRIDTFALKGGKLDLAQHEVVIDDARVGGMHGLIRRAAKGNIEWVKPPALRAVEAAQEEPAVPWKVTVARYVGDDIALRFEDRAVSPAATQSIEGLGFTLENLSTDPDQTAKVALHFKFNRKGEVAVDGSLKPVPLTADLNLDVKTLELLPLQSYFTQKLNVDVTRGMVTVNGHMQLHQNDLASKVASKVTGHATGSADPVLEAQAFSGGFTGEVTIGDFSAVDKLNSADFLRWKSLYFGKVDARLQPDSISVGEIALADFFARVIVSPEGKLNLMQIVRKEGGAAEEAVPSITDPNGPARAVDASSGGGKAVAPVVERKPLMPIKIDKVTLQGGQVRFTDNFVKPNYTATLKQIGGQVTGLSSSATSIANVDLRGSYDDVAPLLLTAKINPLSAKPYLDLQAEVKGIELTPFSSYSGKYAGYAIEKGKLSLFVKYKIENDQLAAENRVFLDQLTFGDPVASPDATKLPVKLAIALLKNRNGEIDINLPISGSLNDPQFSVGGLVVKVIVNLFVKAVTSPFALIGSMFGSDSEQLSNVEFEFGRAAIGPDAQKRLENLAKALSDRPALNLEVAGRVDPERDNEGLKRARIEGKVRALKREDLTRNGVESGSADTLVIDTEEYPGLLERVYKAEKFPKPRNMVGLLKSLPVEEMEKLILANSKVSDEDLRDLGDRRAKAVREWLVDHGVSAGQVFLLPSKLGEDAEKPAAENKTRASRADFSLK